MIKVELMPLLKTDDIVIYTIIPSNCSIILSVSPTNHVLTK
jgi:predicted nucleic acid binding AN1-type Zn finger protein